MGKEIKESSLERKIRRHEVSFSAVQGDKGVDYLDEVIYEHSGKEFADFADNMIKKVDKKVLQRALFKLPKMTEKFCKIIWLEQSKWILPKNLAFPQVQSIKGLKRFFTTIV